MASLTAPAPRSVDQPGEQAYRYARAGVARAGTTRAQYVAPLVAIDWIVRDVNGNILATIDLLDAVLLDSLHITLALNDEPDTCSFTLRPKVWPFGPPLVGQEIRVSWAPGVPLFHGYIVTTQADWRVRNLQPPWIAVQCQDPMWRFDARIVTYRFPAQSVTASIRFLVENFCNIKPKGVQPAHPLEFTTTFVQANMPAIPAFDVVNQRPSTVMRTLTAAVGGGFYIEGLAVHAWPTTVSEPNQTNPTTLTAGLKTFHAFRRTDDATQLRRRTLVEGRRTNTLIALPDIPGAPDNQHLGVPLQDATIFNLAPAVPENGQLCRFGTQWMFVTYPYSVTANGMNPPQTKVNAEYSTLQPPYPQYLVCEPMEVQPPPTSWIRVGNQYTRYESIVGNPLTEVFMLVLPDSRSAYGVFTVNIPRGETVEWVDGCMRIYPAGIGVRYTDVQIGAGDTTLRAHPTDTPVVLLADAGGDPYYSDPSQWPQIEGFVQDGRYAYTGAQARADADLAAFRDPLLSVEWETDDLNALPGRTQAMELSSAALTPAIFDAVTILRVELSFPLRTRPARRACSGGMLKPSTFLDLVVTTTN